MTKRKKSRLTSFKGVRATGKIKKTVRGTVEPGSPHSTAGDAPPRALTFSDIEIRGSRGARPSYTLRNSLRAPQQEQAKAQRPNEGLQAILPVNMGAEIKDCPAPKRRRIALRSFTTPSPPSQPESSSLVLGVDAQIYHDVEGNVQPQNKMVNVVENRLVKFDLSQIRRAIQDVPVPQIENAILHTEPAKIRRPTRPNIDFDEIVDPGASFPDDGFEQLVVLFDDELAIFADEIANGGDGMFDDGVEYIETEVVPPVLLGPAPIRDLHDAAYQDQLEAEIERVRNRRGQKKDLPLGGYMRRKHSQSWSFQSGWS